MWPENAKSVFHFTWRMCVSLYVHVTHWPLDTNVGFKGSILWGLWRLMWRFSMTGELRTSQCSLSYIVHVIPPLQCLHQGGRGVFQCFSVRPVVNAMWVLLQYITKIEASCWESIYFRFYLSAANSTWTIHDYSYTPRSRDSELMKTYGYQTLASTSVDKALCIPGCWLGVDYDVMWRSDGHVTKECWFLQ